MINMAAEETRGVEVIQPASPPLNQQPPPPPHQKQQQRPVTECREDDGSMEDSRNSDAEREAVVVKREGEAKEAEIVASSSLSDEKSTRASPVSAFSRQVNAKVSNSGPNSPEIRVTDSPPPSSLPRSPCSPNNMSNSSSSLLLHPPQSSSPIASACTTPTTAISQSSPLGSPTLPTPPMLFQPFLPKPEQTPRVPFSIDNILKPTFGQRLLLHTMAAQVMAAQQQRLQEQQQQQEQHHQQLLAQQHQWRQGLVSAAAAAAAAAGIIKNEPLPSPPSPSLLPILPHAVRPSHSPRQIPQGPQSSTLSSRKRPMDDNKAGSGPSLGPSSPKGKPVISRPQPVDLSAKHEPQRSGGGGGGVSAGVKAAASDEKSSELSDIKKDDDCPPGMVRGPNGQLWPAWVFCTRYSDRPSSGESLFPDFSHLFKPGSKTFLLTTPMLISHAECLPQILICH